MQESLGVIRVPLVGVPMRATGNQPVPTDRCAVHAILFQALPENTGRVYIGTSAMNRVTKSGVMGTLAVPTANSIPTFSMALTLSPNAIHAHDLYIDADNNTDGVTIAVLTT
jgi:hypothetical protein